MYTTLPPYCGIDFAIVFKAHEDVAKIQLEIDAQCRHPTLIPLIYKTIKVLALECIFPSLHAQVSTEGERPIVFLISVNTVYYKRPDPIFTSSENASEKRVEAHSPSQQRSEQNERVLCNASSYRFQYLHLQVTFLRYCLRIHTDR